MVTHPFQEAMESQDWPAITALLHPDVQFRSPVVFKSYHGRPACLHLMGHVTQVFKDFRYVARLTDEGTTGLVFRATVDGKDLEGLDYLSHDSDGLITELTVMIRPLNGLLSLAQAMSARLENDPVPVG